MTSDFRYVVPEAFVTGLLARRVRCGKGGCGANLRLPCGSVEQRYAAFARRDLPKSNQADRWERPVHGARLYFTPARLTHRDSDLEIGLPRRLLLSVG